MLNSKDCTIYVRNFDSKKITVDLITELFMQVGPVESVTLKEDYAFVDFENEDSVIYACKAMNGIRLFDIPLNVQPRAGSKWDKNVPSVFPEISKNISESLPNSIKSYSHIKSKDLGNCSDKRSNASNMFYNGNDGVSYPEETERFTVTNYIYKRNKKSDKYFESKRRERCSKFDKRNERVDITEEYCERENDIDNNFFEHNLSQKGFHRNESRETVHHPHFSEIKHNRKRHIDGMFISDKCVDKIHCRDIMKPRRYEVDSASGRIYDSMYNHNLRQRNNCDKQGLVKSSHISKNKSDYEYSNSISVEKYNDKTSNFKIPRNFDKEKKEDLRNLIKRRFENNILITVENQIEFTKPHSYNANISTHQFHIRGSESKMYKNHRNYPKERGAKKTDERNNDLNVLKKKEENYFNERSNSYKTRYTFKDKYYNNE